MMNNEGPYCEYFDELCALAAIGQISEAEFVELRDHMQSCEQCRSSYGEFIDLIHNKLPLADPALTGASRGAGLFSEGSSYRERFLTRARKQGLTVSNAVSRGVSSRNEGRLFPQLDFGHLAAAAIVLLVVTSGILAFQWKESSAQNKVLVAKLAAMNRPSDPPVQPAVIAVKEIQKDERPSPRSLPAEQLQITAPSAMDNSAELAQIRAANQDALESARTLEEKLRKASDELAGVKEQQLKDSNKYEARIEEASRESSQAKREIQNLTAEIDRLNADLTRSDLAIRQLEEQKTPKPPLQFQSVLYAKGGENINRIVGAHIADVRDADSKGKEGRASARIFYTDGKAKSLLFLAFGLRSRARSKGSVFQVWGATGSEGTSPRSLGTLEQDNPSVDVWALPVSDPAKLAGIDTVFVTVEKAEGSKRPTTEKLMYAYLREIPVQELKEACMN